MLTKELRQTRHTIQPVATTSPSLEQSSPHHPTHRHQPSNPTSAPAPPQDSTASIHRHGRHGRTRAAGTSRRRPISTATLAPTSTTTPSWSPRCRSPCAPIDAKTRSSLQPLSNPFPRIRHVQHIPRHVKEPAVRHLLRKLQRRQTGITLGDTISQIQVGGLAEQDRVQRRVQCEGTQGLEGVGCLGGVVARGLAGDGYGVFR